MPNRFGNRVSWNKKNQDKRMHRLPANWIAKMANPNQVGNTKWFRTKRSIIFLRISFAKMAKMNLSWVSKWNLLTEIKLPIETKRIRSKGSFIFLQIKLPKWQIQIRLATQKESGQKEASSSCESSLPKSLAFQFDKSVW